MSLNPAAKPFSSQITKLNAGAQSFRMPDVQKNYVLDIFESSLGRTLPDRRTELRQALTSHPAVPNMILKNNFSKLRKAIKVNDIEAADRILRGAKGYTNQGISGQALHLASNYGRTEIFYSILANSNLRIGINPKAANNALNNAAYYGNDQNVKLLLDKTNCGSNPNALYHALESRAAMGIEVRGANDFPFGNARVIGLLQDARKLLMGEGKPSIRPWTFKKLCATGDSNTVQKIVEISNITPKIIEEGLIGASNNNHVPVVDYLLQTRLATPKAIEEATVAASSKQSLETVKRLLKTGKLTSQALWSAFVHPHTSRNSDVMQLLMDTGKFKLDNLKSLLNGGTFSPSPARSLVESKIREMGAAARNIQRVFRGFRVRQAIRKRMPS